MTDAPLGSTPAASGATGSCAADVTIVNRKGLHARASAKFVRLAESFNAIVTVSRGGETVGGSSIMGLMMLAASIGSSIHITAEGADAEKALTALVALVADGFGEED
jgi:phosphocarrier protein